VKGAHFVRPNNQAHPIAHLSQRQLEILQVATDLFKSRGYHGTRMDDVAAGASLNKATIYHYFPSKADILFMMCLQTLTEALEWIDKNPGDSDPVAELTVFTHATVSLTARTLHRSAVYFQEAPFLDHWLSPDQVKQLRALEKTYDEHLTDIFARGIAQGRFAASDARVAALGYSGMVSWVYRWYSPKGSMTPQDIADQFLSLVVRRDSNQKGRKKAKATGGKQAAVS
jgi:AcrR family transcriptional regulator